MKIRSGFVSNSSSSSFCILGTDDREICKGVAEHFKIPDSDSHDFIDDNFDGHGYGSYVSKEDPDVVLFISNYTDDGCPIAMVGVSVGQSSDYEGEWNIPDNVKPLKEKAAKKISKFTKMGVKKIKLLYGEWSNGG